MELYRHFFGQAIQALSAPITSVDGPGTPQTLEVSFLLFKVITKLVVYGWGGAPPVSAEERQAKEGFIEQQKQFCVSTVADFQTLQDARKAKVQAGQLTEYPHLGHLNKHVAAYIKFYKALLTNNHHNFHDIGITQQVCGILWSNIAEGSQDLLRYVSDEDSAVLFPEKFFVNNLLFVKMCFVQWPCAMRTWKDPAFAAQAADLIVSRLLPLRTADLQRWQEEPEEWFKEEEEERWQFDLRVSRQDSLASPSLTQVSSARCPSVLGRHCQKLREKRCTPPRTVHAADSLWGRPFSDFLNIASDHFHYSRTNARADAAERSSLHSIRAERDRAGQACTFRTVAGQCSDPRCCVGRPQVSLQMVRC